LLSQCTDSIDGHNSHHLEGELIDVLYSQHNKLETVFRFFDKDGDGKISREEFVQGCECLNALLDEGEKLTDFDRLLGVLDIAQTGSVDINEFFECFRLSDAQRAMNESKKASSPANLHHATPFEKRHSMRRPSFIRGDSSGSLGARLKRETSVDSITDDMNALNARSIHVDGAEGGDASPRKMATAPTSPDDGIDI